MHNLWYATHFEYGSYIMHNILHILYDMHICIHKYRHTKAWTQQVMLLQTVSPIVQARCAKLAVRKSAATPPN